MSSTDAPARGQIPAMAGGSRPDAAAPGGLRRFGLSLAALLAAVCLLLLWRGRAGGAAWVGAGSLLAALCGVAAPRLLAPVRRALVAAGFVLGWINTRIILALIFFLIFTPAALVMKLFGRDPLARRFDPSKSTYWVKKSGENRGPERYRKMY